VKRRSCGTGVAPDVYLGVVPLGLDENGRLAPEAGLVSWTGSSRCAGFPPRRCSIG
jgi:hypothetical protein